MLYCLCMYVCMCVVWASVRMYVGVCECMCGYTVIHLRESMRAYERGCVYIYICTHACVYACVCVVWVL